MNKNCLIDKFSYIPWISYLKIWLQKMESMHWYPSIYREHIGLIQSDCECFTPSSDRSICHCSSCNSCHFLVTNISHIWITMHYLFYFVLYCIVLFCLFRSFLQSKVKLNNFYLIVNWSTKNHLYIFTYEIYIVSICLSSSSFFFFFDWNKFVRLICKSFTLVWSFLHNKKTNENKWNHKFTANQ